MSSKRQLNLFDTTEGLRLSDNTSIIKLFSLEISKDDDPGLTKLKKNFNHRIKAIQKLKEDLEKTSQVIRELNKSYNKHVKPTQEELTAHKLQALDTMHTMFHKKTFSWSKKETIRGLILDEIDLLRQDGIEVDVKYEEYFNVDFTNVDEGVKDSLGELFHMLTGMDVDIEDFLGDHKLSEEEVRRKYADQINEKIREEEADQGKSRGKSKGENIADSEEDYIHHINKLYKSLAKKTHPDLEQDEYIRKEKELLMQQLAHAKDTKDLFQLISLKLKIEKITNQDTIIDENYLRVYADKLLEQKKELEMDLWILKTRSGFQSWLYQQFYSPYKNTILEKLKRHKDVLLEQINDYKIIIEAGKSVKAFNRFLSNIEEEEELNETQWGYNFLEFLVGSEKFRL
jgi:hypothetical protein